MINNYYLGVTIDSPVEDYYRDFMRQELFRQEEVKKFKLNNQKKKLITKNNKVKVLWKY